MNGKNKKIDERQKELIGKGMALSAAFAFIYEIMIIIYMFNKIGSIKTVYPEIILVITMFLFMVMYYIAAGEYDSSIEKGKKRANIFKIDEREKMRIIASVGMAGFVAMLYSTGVIIFRLIQTSKFESSYTFIGLLGIMAATNTIYHLINKEYHVPTTLSGKKLALGDSKEEKKARLIYYVKDALKLAVVFLIFDIMNPDRVIFRIPSIDSQVLLPYFLNSFFRIIIFFIINYIWGEFNVKKQRKFDESLDNDEIDVL